MVDSKMTYSQRLKPDEIQRVYDVLRIPWREYEPDDQGWISIDGDYLHQCGMQDERFKQPYFLGRPSFNIQHGGWISHNDIGFVASLGYNLDGDEAYVKKTVKGDLVDLVRLFLFSFEQGKDKDREAIAFINNVLGKRIIDQGEFDGKIRAKDFISKKIDIFVIVPKQLLHAAISASAKIVWCEIHDQCRKGKYCSWPSITTISDRTKLSRPTVTRALNELEKAGYLVISRLKGSNNFYYPVVPGNEKEPVKK